MMRYVRYAAAVFFALLAVGFVALWVRSYYVHDSLFRWRSGMYLGAASWQGGLRLSYSSTPRNRSENFPWRLNSTPTDEWLRHRRAAAGWSGKLIEPRTVLGFGYKPSTGFTTNHVMVPHWFLALSSLGLAALFAFKRTWRYSLRTILVATTLLAGLLGLAVYAV